jgi:two-component system NarL family sensor kinase
VTEFGQRWNLKTTCTIPSQPTEISPEVERAIYRILQEALSNARQHAQCKQLTVTLAMVDQEWISLEICDDGVGFEVNQSNRKSDQRPGKGLGLTSMRERAQRVGGQLRVESGANRGARIVALLPLQEIITTINQAEEQYE